MGCTSIARIPHSNHCHAMKSSHIFPLTGMSCGSCVSKITAKLLEHPDISEAEVTLSPPQAKLMGSRAISPVEINAWLEPLGKYQVPVDTGSVIHAALPEKSVETYKPLLILLGYLVVVILASSLSGGRFLAADLMRHFMGGFFIAFSFFKMLDLDGFSQSYRTYDLVAKAWPAYGLIYPFVELFLGLAYLVGWQPQIVNSVTAIVMGVSLLGVIRAVTSKQTIRCACLGTVFNLPMSTVTIIEDGSMLLMALASIFLPH